MNDETKRLQLTPTITAGAYAAGDVVGGSLIWQIGSNENGGTIRQLLIVDDADQKAALKLWLFNAPPTLFADNAPFAPVIADLQKLVGVVAIAGGDYTTVNGNAYANKEGINLSYSTNVGLLYGYLVCDATPTYAATTDLTIVLTAWVD